MTLSLREFHPRRVEVRAARVIISRTARYHNSPLSIIHSPFSIKKEIGKANLFLCYSIASTSSILVRYLS